LKEGRTWRKTVYTGGGNKAEPGGTSGGKGLMCRTLPRRFIGREDPAFKRANYREQAGWLTSRRKNKRLPEKLEEETPEWMSSITKTTY